jgi:hypothetical protein
MLSAALAACSSAVAPTRDALSPDASVLTGARTDTVSVRLGSSAVLDGGRLELKFEARVAESRCPANVTCVWAGDAHVRLITRVAGGTATEVDLHTALQPNTLKVDCYTISMIGLTPYPGTGRDTETPVAILRVSSE